MDIHKEDDEVKMQPMTWNCVSILPRAGFYSALKQSKSSYFRFQCDLHVLVTDRRHVNCPFGGGRIAIDLHTHRILGWNLYSSFDIIHLHM